MVYPAILPRVRMKGKTPCQFPDLPAGYIGPAESLARTVAKYQADRQIGAAREPPIKVRLRWKKADIARQRRAARFYGRFIKAKLQNLKFSTIRSLLVL
jgi:hypothetical protein